MLVRTQAVLEHGLSAKETRVLPRSLFCQSGAAMPFFFCGPLHCKQLCEGAAPLIISSHWPALNTVDPCQSMKGVRADTRSCLVSVSISCSNSRGSLE